MDDFSGQIIYQWKYEHFCSFLPSFSIYYTLFSEKMEKSNFAFKYIIYLHFHYTIPAFLKCLFKTALPNIPPKIPPTKQESTKTGRTQFGVSSAKVFAYSAPYPSDTVFKNSLLIKYILAKNPLLNNEKKEYQIKEIVDKRQLTKFSNKNTKEPKEKVIEAEEEKK